MVGLNSVWVGVVSDDRLTSFSSDLSLDYPYQKNRKNLPVIVYDEVMEVSLSSVSVIGSKYGFSRRTRLLGSRESVWL